jgi:hypothetical protein
MAKSISVFGVYQDEGQAGKAVDALRESGCRNSDVSVVASASTDDTKAQEGAESAPLLGETLGWLAEAGTLAIPGGPFVATGPLIALLENVGAVGTVEGLAGALIGAGTPEHHAKQYQARVESGHVLLSVHCADAERADAAREVLERTGAEDISTCAQSASAAETLDSASDYDADFRENYATNHADFGAAYQDAASFYEFGFKMARSGRFAGKNFEDAEPELKAAYLLEFPSGDWDQISNMVLYGWERAGGEIRQGFILI